ncbi:FAD-dependent oxidoreductase [Candidatus Pacearchaeota archaeon]|nr:MAG: FAD-dependent oxidoreductase [Candidatus Pacearchaeota archaeon]
MEKYTVKVRENNCLTDWVHQLILEKPNQFSFLAGQFVMVKTEKGTRPYSLASSPAEDFLELCIKKTGEVSSVLCSVQEGSKIQIIGPNGNFTFKSKEAQEIFFIATGTGIAPLKSMISDIIDRFNGKMTLLFGTKTKKDILYEDYFRFLERKYKNFSYIVTLSRENWEGHRGHVDEVLRKIVKEPRAHLYLCGLKEMIESVRKAAEEIGFKENQIYFERYS